MTFLYFCLLIIIYTFLFVCLFVVVFFLLIQKVINKYIYTYFSAVIMAQSTLILVAALLISTLSYCSAENVYCVTPTATSCSSCPHNSSHCATLSEYAQEAHLYFTSNTTMVFLPGDHVLHTNITVTSVARLIMHGESSSGNIVTIVCNGSVGLSFTSMVDFKIDSLAFTSCSRRYYVTPPGIPGWYTYISVHAALLLQYTQYAELVNCSFHHNHGTALVVNNTNITLENINFVQNHVYCKGDDNLGGGGIIATNSNLTFTGNTTFLDNRAFCGPLDYGVNGGAILAYGNTVLSFNGASTFINNSGTIGGAIYISGNTVLSFNGSSNFINNEAYYYHGGAIQATNALLNFNGTSNFINNLAANYGGAIITHNTLFSLLV